jgi:polyketide synthase-associated protein
VKGFVTISLGLEASDLKDALAEARGLKEHGRFYQPAFQIMEGLLGPEGSCRIAELEPPEKEANETRDGRALRKLDMKITTVGLDMMPYADQLGLGISHRTNSIVHEAGAAEDDTPPLTEKVVTKWLVQFMTHRVMAILFLGPSKGTLEVRPYENDDTEAFEVRAVPGMLVLLRPDMLSHKYYAPGNATSMTSFYLTAQKQGMMYGQSVSAPISMTPIARALDEWVLDRLKQIKEAETEETVWDPDIPRDWQLAMNHMFHKGQMIGITGIGLRVPRFIDCDLWFSSMGAGIDFVTEVPNTRWDHSKVYLPYEVEPEGWKMFKTYCKHGSFMDGIDLFDPKLFGMSPAEAKAIDPNQRLVLEVGYDGLYRSGLRKKQIMNSSGGMYCGFGTLEWSFTEKQIDEGAFGATGGAASIVSNRMSFCLGMKGPSMSIDTEASASLTALYLAAEATQKKGRGHINAYSLAMGVHLMLCPMWWPQHCAAGWLSKEGRCLTFDDSACGFVRSDACVSTVVKCLEDVDGETQKDRDRNLCGILAAGVMNHCGQGASLHAPSGPAEQEVIAEAIKNAHISMLDVDAVEAHGTGAKLADAVEVGSLLRGHRSEMHKEPLGLMACKTGPGNMIEAGSLTAFIKTLTGGTWGFMPPNKHLRQINPYVDSVDTPSMFLTESVQYRMKSSFVGTMARGFGGTNVYCIAFGQVDNNKVSDINSQQPPMLAFWPGGGGMMDESMIPDRTYYIVGSFNKWGDPLPMEREGDSGYAFNLIMGENNFEQFQIWLDGDSKKVLHPGWQKAGKDAPVIGPTDDVSSNGLNWMIDGRGSVQEMWIPAVQAKESETAVSLRRDLDEMGNEYVLQQHITPTPDLGKPGDRYRVRLQCLGKWRTVNWTKIDTPALSDKLASTREGNYFIVGSWGNWQFEEMTNHGDGKYSAEVKLSRGGAEFQIVRDRDWFQVFYPATPQGNGQEYIVGPRDGGHGLNWFIDGLFGETFRVEFERQVVGDKDEKKVSWTRL